MSVNCNITKCWVYTRNDKKILAHAIFVICLKEHFPTVFTLNKTRNEPYDCQQLTKGEML